MVAILACSSLLVTSCYEAYPAYGGVAVGAGPGGIGVSASAEWTNASYDASGYPIYGYSYGRPVYGYTAAGVAIFTLAALTTAYYLPYWGCAHWCHHHDVYIHYCPHHHHKCWAPPRCPRGHMPHVRPPHDGPHPGKGVHVKAPSHRGVPDSGRPPHMQPGGPNRGMQPMPGNGMKPNRAGGMQPNMQPMPGNGMKPNRAGGMQPNMQPMPGNGMKPTRAGNMAPNMQNNRAMQRAVQSPQRIQAADMSSMRRNSMQGGMQPARSNRMQTISTPSGTIRNYGPGASAVRFSPSGGGSRSSAPSVGASRSSAPSFGGSRPSAPSLGGGGASRSHSSPGFGGGGHRSGGFGGGRHGRR